MGSLGTYPFPSPVTLFDGRVITDPEHTEPTREDCIPYMCGADPANQNARMYCSWHGRSGAMPGCTDPECAPYKSAIPYCTLPVATPAPAASIFTPPVPPPPPPPLTLTPANIVQPLPDITRTLAAQPATVECSLWSQLNGAIANHPGVALAILAGATYLVWKGNR